MKTRSLLRKLAKFYPKRLREPWDYGGLMAGKRKEEIKRVVLLLDLDPISFALAKDFHPDAIFTHHPFFFGPKKKILKEDEEKANLVREIEKENIMVFSYHTNFDAAIYGMNDALAKKLLLEDIQPLVGDSMAFGGHLPQKMEIHEFATYALNKLGSESASLIASSPYVYRVAILGGAGSRSWKMAKEEGYDIFVSGDCPHHVRRDIINAHYNYLDIPHEIERAFMERMKEVLLEIDPSLEIISFDHEKEWETILKK